MKFSRRQAAKFLAAPIFFGAAATQVPRKASASEATPEFREAVQAAMLEYIDATKINGKHLVFDPLQGDYIPATFQKLHTNLMRVADTFFVSCADFLTDDGDLLDIDYMVADSDGYWTVFQSAIHIRGGELRESHMETVEVLFEREGGCGSKCCAGCCGSKCCAAKCCAATCCGVKCTATCCAAKD